MDTKSNSIKVDSDPKGAKVFANDREIGVTPITIVPGDHFSTGAQLGSKDGVGLFSVSYVGNLKIEKTGCKPFQQKVDDYILSRDVFAKLDCAPISDVQHVAESAVTTPSAVDPKQTSGQETVQRAQDAATRLKRIDELHRKGLISEEEHRMLRKRVLDTL